MRERGDEIKDGTAIKRDPTLESKKDKAKRSVRSSLEVWAKGQGGLG